MRFLSANTVVKFLRHGVDGASVTKRIFWCCVANRECFGVGEHTAIDCKKSLFFTKICGKERKTSKRARVTVSVTCSQCSLEPVVPRASQDEQGEHVTLTVTLACLLVLRCSPRILREKKDCLLSHTALNIPISYTMLSSM